MNAMWMTAGLSLFGAITMFRCHQQAMILQVVVEKILRGGGYEVVARKFEDKQFYNLNLNTISILGFGFHGALILWTLGTFSGAKIAYGAPTDFDIIMFCFGVSACLPYYIMLKQYVASSNFGKFCFELTEKMGTKITTTE